MGTTALPWRCVWAELGHTMSICSSLRSGSCFTALTKAFHSFAVLNNTTESEQFDEAGGEINYLMLRPYWTLISGRPNFLVPLVFVFVEGATSVASVSRRDFLKSRIHPSQSERCRTRFDYADAQSGDVNRGKVDSSISVTFDADHQPRLEGRHQASRKSR
jgi:hypothetical protein